MGFDLIGPGRAEQWNNNAWRNLLELAECYGWTPAGTGPPRGRLKAQWRGDVRIATYVSNDGARFYARDAAAFADALEKALPDIPIKPLAQGREPKTTLDFFAGWGRKDLRAFIRFCRKGGFRIF